MDTDAFVNGLDDDRIVVIVTPPFVPCVGKTRSFLLFGGAGGGGLLAFVFPGEPSDNAGEIGAYSDVGDVAPGEKSGFFCVLFEPSDPFRQGDDGSGGDSAPATADGKLWVLPLLPRRRSSSGVRNT